MEHIVRSVRGSEHRRGVCSAQMRSSAASFAEISPDMILGYGVGNGTFLFDMKLLSSYVPLVAHISAGISPLGNTPALIHLLLCIVRHIDQSEPVEHPVNISHTPDIT